MNPSGMNESNSLCVEPLHSTLSLWYSSLELLLVIMVTFDHIDNNPFYKWNRPAFWIVKQTRKTF